MRSRGRLPRGRRRWRITFAAGGPLPATGLPRRKSELVARTVAAFCECADSGKFRHPSIVDPWEAKHQGFDTGEGEIVSRQAGRYTLKAAMAAIDNVPSLQPVSAFQDFTDFIGRSGAPAGQTVVTLGAPRHGDSSEGYALRVARQSWAASRNEAVCLARLEGH
jgi:hypothetical protein